MSAGYGFFESIKAYGTARTEHNQDETCERDEKSFRESVSSAEGPKSHEP